MRVLSWIDKPKKIFAVSCYAFIGILIVLVWCYLTTFVFILVTEQTPWDYYRTKEAPYNYPTSTWSTKDEKISFYADSDHCFYGVFCIDEKEYEFYSFEDVEHCMHVFFDELPPCVDYKFDVYWEDRPAVLIFRMTYKKNHCIAEVAHSKICEVEVGETFHFYRTDLE